MQNQIIDQYPTAKFPTEYTKQGQQILMQKFVAGQNQQAVEVQQTPEVINSDESFQQETAQQPTIDIHKLMPLIKSMSQNKALSKNDLMKAVLPMLSGNNGEYSELINMMIDNNSQEKDLIDLSFDNNSTKPKIASFRRVE